MSTETAKKDLETFEKSINELGKSINESGDAIRYIQRRIETIVTQILEDKEVSKEIKLDALVKYHNILLKATKTKQA